LARWLFLKSSAVARQLKIGLVAEGQVLQDTVSIGWSEQRGLSQRPAAFGLFALQQMTTACPMEQHFPVGGYLETFGY
jgi:hypothetical protein